MNERQEEAIYREGYRRGKEEEHKWWSFHCAKCTDADRPRGEWIIHKAPTDEYCSLVECPFCGEELVGEAHEYNFCPNCGAEMKGADDE